MVNLLVNDFKMTSVCVGQNKFYILTIISPIAYFTKKKFIRIDKKKFLLSFKIQIIQN